MGQRELRLKDAAMVRSLDTWGADKCPGGLEPLERRDRGLSRHTGRGQWKGQVQPLTHRGGGPEQPGR